MIRIARESIVNQIRHHYWNDCTQMCIWYCVSSNYGYILLLLLSLLLFLFSFQFYFFQVVSICNSFLACCALLQWIRPHALHYFMFISWTEIIDWKLWIHFVNIAKRAVNCTLLFRTNNSIQSQFSMDQMLLCIRIFKIPCFVQWIIWKWFFARSLSELLLLSFSFFIVDFHKIV